MYGMYFWFAALLYCNLLRWRNYYYHFFTYIHVLFLTNVFKRKKFKLQVTIYETYQTSFCCIKVRVGNWLLLPVLSAG